LDTSLRATRNSAPLGLDTNRKPNARLCVRRPAPRRHFLLADLALSALGLALLVVGGDAMIRGASALATRLGISPLVVGLTVVAFGTSAPELSVNLAAALRGSTELAFGNVIGSNLANIGLIIGIAALIRPIAIHEVIIRREVPMMLLATLVATCLGADALFAGNAGASTFVRADGLVLILLFSVFLYYTLGDLRQESDEGADPERAASIRLPRAIAQTIAGLAALVAGGATTVAGATGVASALGIPDAVIGFTLVAVGTSLPELTASLIATLRGHTDLAVANVVGSNIFNVLFVLGATAAMTPVAVPDGGALDLLASLALSFLLLVVSRTQGHRIIRAEAAVLLGCYVAYVAYRAI